MHNSYWLIAILLFCISPLSSQVVPTPRIAEVKEGLIIVVLPDDSKAIDALKELRETPNISDGVVRRLDRRIKKIERSTAQVREGLIEGFSREFNFTNTAFITARALKAYTIVPDIKWLQTEAGTPYSGLLPETQLLARLGTIGHQNRKINALVLTNINGNLLTGKIPTSVQLGGPTSLFYNDKDNVRRVIRILDRRLRSAYRKRR